MALAMAELGSVTTPQMAPGGLAEYRRAARARARRHTTKRKVVSWRNSLLNVETCKGKPKYANAGRAQGYRLFIKKMKSC
jgi:hypothetical protein